MVHPTANGLIKHQEPTLSQQILDVAETQGEPDIKPDCLLDDFGREAVAAIAALGHHRWLRLKVTDGKPTGDVTMPSKGIGIHQGEYFRSDRFCYSDGWRVQAESGNGEVRCGRCRWLMIPL